MPLDTASPFKLSRLSWFRCAHCGAETYPAASRTIIAREHPRITVEYKCERCGGVSRLRNPGLLNVGVPFAVAACAFLVAYNVLLMFTSWYSPYAISTLIAIVGIDVAISMAISRVVKRFDKA
jgi:DNA-directed RNA polymerase subunit RPC12/RpoP